MNGKVLSPNLILANMSLEEKVGQMMIMGFHGRTPSSNIRTLIEEYHVGGVSLFSRNVSDPHQVSRLVQELQNVALRSKPCLRLLVATDQEGGLVARLRRGFAVHPGNMALGAAGSGLWARAAGEVTGRELNAAGINMNLAPVLDVNSNPRNPVIGVRSFSEDPALVSTLGAAMIQGLQHVNVIATAKHFPGHGDTSQDSHEVLPTLAYSFERLRRVELRPFQNAISCGVMAVMIGHLSIPAIDKTFNLPATMSKRVITKLLRESLGYEGLVTTDCMEMKAITSSFEAGEAAVAAVKAGVDLIMVSHTFRRQLESIRAVQDAVRDGRIEQRQIERSVLRILEAKSFATRKIVVKPRMRVVGSKKHLRSVAKMAKESITLTRNRNVLPLTSRRWKRVLSLSFVPPSFGRGTKGFIGVLRRKAPLHIRIRGLDCDPRPSREQIGKIRAMTYWAELVIAGTYDVTHNLRQERILREIAGRVPLVLVSMREPYDVAHVPEASAHIAAYSPAGCSVEAVVDMIVGGSKPAGRLPVSIPPLYTKGHGLKGF